jgi:site-specific recombinase XerD
MRLLDLFDRFLLHLEHERQCSRGTLQAYRVDFLQFLAWLDRTLEAERAAGLRPKKGGTHDLLHFTTERIRAWQASLSMERRLSPAAIRRKLYAMSAFTKFLVGTGTIGPSQNPMLGVVSPKRRRRIRQGLTLEEWRKVLDLPLPPREHAIRATLALAGVRREELITLQGADVNLERPTQSTLRVRGKGDKERLVPVPAPLREVLLDHILRTGRTGPRELLFTQENGRPLTPRVVNAMASRWGRRLGLHLYPHRFRHAYATFMGLMGVPMPVLQEWLGHEDIATTAGYIHAAHDTAAREVLEKFAGSVRESVLGKVLPAPPASS